MSCQEAGWEAILRHAQKSWREFEKGEKWQQICNLQTHN